MPDADIVVIDDSSTDLTAEAARSAGAHVIRLPCNLGIGGAVQTGLKFARERMYDVVIRLDGDGQHDPAEIPALYELLKKGPADVVIGSRFLGVDESRVSIPMSRLLGIKTFAFLVSLLTRQKATDTTSGFMCMNRQAVSILADFLPQDYPEVEGRIILHKAGLAVAETPACMRARVAGISSITAWRSIYYAVKVSIAVLICAMKDIPLAPKEREHDHDSSRSAHRRHPVQPHPVAGDRAVDTEAQTT
jgi:glycosyltransferase involved in cell wall biosynthesis